MALQANALVTLADAKSFFTITGSADDTKLEKVIDRASDWIEQHCNRPLKEATYTARRLAGPASKMLGVQHGLAVPINVGSALTVKVDGTTQTVWKIETDGDQEDFDVIVAPAEGAQSVRLGLYRANGWDQGRGDTKPFNVLLTYTGGYATVPDDLQEAAFLVIQKIWRAQQKQLDEIQAVTMPSGSVTMFDTVLPRRAVVLLGPYRVVPI